MKAGSEHKPEVHPQQHHTCSVSLPKGKKKNNTSKKLLENELFIRQKYIQKPIF